MKAVERRALGGVDEHERFDGPLANQIFGQINESWEEAYADQDPEDWDKEIPRNFLTGRQAFIHHIFYRVLMLHQAEVKAIEAEGKVTE